MGSVKGRHVRIVQFLDVPIDEAEGGYAGYHQRVGMLANGLRSRGCVVDHISLRDLKTYSPTISKLLAWRQLRRKIAGYDAIHAAGTVTAGITALAVRGAGTKMIYDVHGDAAAEMALMWRHTHRRAYLEQVVQTYILDRLALRSAHGVLVVSAPSFELQVSRGVPAERILLTRNGADLEFFRKLPVRAEDGVFRVCYSGGFHAWQGIENLASACELLKSRGWPDNLRLRMIGLSADTQAVRDRFAAILRDSFEPVDRVSQQQMYGLFQDADMMVIPRTPHLAVRVAMPTKFAEYVASGRPVLVTDVDETAQFVRDYDCGLVAEPTPEGVAGRLAEAARLTRGRIAEMGTNARRLAETLFNWETTGARYYDFLMKTLGTDGR